MKAWQLSNNKDDDAGLSLVFADNVSDAKKQAYSEDDSFIQHPLEPDSWIDIRAIRAPELDDWEGKPDMEIMYRLITKCDWYFYVGDEEWNPDNVEEFREKYLKESANGKEN